MEEKKGIPFSIFGVCLIVVLIIGIGLGWVFGKKVESKDKCKAESVTEVDESAKKKLDYNLEILLSGVAGAGVSNPILEKTRNVEDFEKDALVGILYYADRNVQSGNKYDFKDYEESTYCFDTVSKKRLSGNCSSSENESIYDELAGEFSASKFATDYKNLYGLDLEKRNYRGCPQLFYDEENDKYYTRYQCGGTGGLYPITYTYKYEAVGDAYYVYVAAGFVAPTAEAMIYYDYNGNNKSKYSAMNYKIGEDNYNEFSKYKFTFEKNGDEYHFKRVELL